MFEFQMIIFPLNIFPRRVCAIWKTRKAPTTSSKRWNCSVCTPSVSTTRLKTTRISSNSAWNVCCYLSKDRGQFFTPKQRNLKVFPNCCLPKKCRSEKSVREPLLSQDWELSSFEKIKLIFGRILKKHEINFEWIAKSCSFAYSQL